MSVALNARFLPVAAGLLLLSACDRPAPTNGVAPAPPPAAIVDESRKTGVPECDDYLERYEACISAHAPESAREPLRVALDRSRASWRKLAAASPDHRALAQVCVNARAASRLGMQRYGCSDF